MSKAALKSHLKRREVTETHCGLQGGETLAELVEAYGINCYLDVQFYYDSADIFLKETRLETDDEYHERMRLNKEERAKEVAKNRQNKKTKLEAEKKEFERLKAKFEK